MKPLSSSFAMFAARFNSHVSELTEMSKPHLPSWSWTHELVDAKKLAHDLGRRVLSASLHEFS